MAAAYFYHMTDSTLAETLPVLLEKCLGAGWRAMVRGSSEMQLKAIDMTLWKGNPTSFIPHGIAGGDHDADQPILLTMDTGDNGAKCLFSIGGAVVTAEEIAPLERCFILFDGMDEQAVTVARAQWKTLTVAGAEAVYWSQETGRWEEKARSAKP